MSLSHNDQKYIDNFFRDIQPLEVGYRNGAFSYLAIKGVDGFSLVQGRVFLNAKEVNSTFSHFQSSNIRAGRYRLSELNTDARSIVQQVTSGKFETPHGDLLFPASTGWYRASYVPFHPEGLQGQRRISVLSIFGRQMNLVRQPDLDWELKASSPPYHGLQELTAEYILPPILRDSSATLEIAALSVAEIDVQRSTVIRTRAIFHVIAASGLETSKIMVGYSVHSQGKVVLRSIVPGREMCWTLEDEIQRGQAEIDVPAAVTINATISYDGIAQHYWWFSDPSTFQNPRRAIYENFDAKLDVLNDIISKAQGRGQSAHDFEAAIEWLVWMLGFGVVQLGNTPRTRDAPDLVATTPAGHFALIECTTGLLKAENKLSLLHDRAEATRRALIASNNAHARVLPVIVTSKTRTEIKPDLEQAERWGIVVLTSEDLEQLINQTLVLPNADQLYQQAEERARAVRAQHEVEAQLPLQGGG